MYVFAKRYEIGSLKSLAVMKLEDFLADHTLFPERIRAVVALLNYIYAKTTESEDEYKSMREMLCYYMSQEIDTLISDDEFRKSLKKDGCLTITFRPR